MKMIKNMILPINTFAFINLISVLNEMAAECLMSFETNGILVSSLDTDLYNIFMIFVSKDKLVSYTVIVEQKVHLLTIYKICMIM